MPIARVAINVPVDTLFDYSAEYISSSDIGLRVSVPFGKSASQALSSMLLPTLRLIQKNQIHRANI